MPNGGFLLSFVDMGSFVTMDDARRVLKLAGLTIQTAEPTRLQAVAAPPLCLGGPEARFPITLEQTRRGWKLQLRHAPLQRFDTLVGALNAAFSQMNTLGDFFSPEYFGDRYARFEGDNPSQVVEDALVSAGWLPPPLPALAALGVQFLAGTTFDAYFPEQNRVVFVATQRVRGPMWRMVVETHPQDPTIPQRTRRPPYSGEPGERDVESWKLTQRVSTTIHSRLSLAVTNLRWALHHDPLLGDSRSEPTGEGPA